MLRVSEKCRKGKTRWRWAFRLENHVYAKKRKKGKGDYFFQKCSRDRYPTSEAAKALSNSDEFMEASRNSVDSDVCRTITDMDRYLRLVENLYGMWYKGELFVARKNNCVNIKRRAQGMLNV